MKNRGLKHYRLSDPLNADELAFAKMWDKLNNGTHVYPSVLQHIVSNRQIQEPSDRDVEVAASVI